MGLIKEFREFAVRGNVVDMAVGIIIGAAFGKIISSLVTDVVLPPIGVLIGGVDFTSLAFTLKPGMPEIGTTAAVEPVLLRYGVFLQTVFDFAIVAFVIFIVIKGINRLRRAEAARPPAPPAPSRQELLLEEIRDLLRR